MPRALICEDDPAIRSLLRITLEREGIDTEAVADGAAAILLLADSDFHVVVLDLMMPGVSGFDVLENMKSRRPALVGRTIVTTAAVSAARRFTEPVASVIEKPFDLAHFTAVVRRVLDS